MAQVPYQGGVSDVQPDARPPDDYLHVDASPAAFGGAIGQGLEKAGAGALDLGKFWGNVQAQDASNKAEKEMAAVAAHVSTLEGQDALDAKDASLKQIDDITTKYAANLSPEAALQFNSTTTPYKNRFIRGQMDTTFVRAGKTVAEKTNNDNYANGIDMATTAGSQGDWKNVEVGRAKAFMALKIDAQQKGVWNETDAMQSANEKANAAYASAIEARAMTNPDEAWARLQIPEIRNALGSNAYRVEATVKKSLNEAYVSKADALATTNPKGAEAFVQANEAKFGDRYGEALDRAHRASLTGGAKSFWDDTAAQPRAAPPTAPASPARPAQLSGMAGGTTAVNYNQHLSSGDVQGALRASEGLRTDAYWDVNHWRTGYGSDTVTRADGSVEPVTAATQITPADAERDLQRRTAISAQHVQQAIGPAAWNGISAGAQAALVSVDYNYGHVPQEISRAAASGDMNALAGAIAARAADNNNANAQRRMAEASAVNGKFSLAGVEATTSPQRRMAPVPDNAGAIPAEAGSAPAPALPVEQAAFTLPAPPASPAVKSYEDAVVAANDAFSNGLLQAKAAGKSPEELEAIQREGQVRLNFALAAADETRTQVAARERAATDDVLGAERKEGYAAAYQKLNAYMNDPRQPISEKQYDTLNDVLEKRFGNPNPITLGPKYGELQNRVAAKPNDPNRLGDVIELQQAEARGDISSKGYDRLYKLMMEGKQSLDEFGLQRSVIGAYDYAERALGAVKDPLTGQHNQKAKDLYDLDFTNGFNRQYDDWKRARAAGKGPDTFSLFEHKNMDAYLETIYSSRDRAEDKTMDWPHASDADSDVWKYAPPGVDPKGWQTFMGMLSKGHNQYADRLEKLASNPITEAPKWDASPVSKVISAEKVLQLIGVRGPTPVDKETRDAGQQPVAPQQQPAPSAPGFVSVALPVAAADLPNRPMHEITMPKVEIGGFHPENLVSPALRHDVSHASDLIGNWLTLDPKMTGAELQQKLREHMRYPYGIPPGGK
jgi:GH24 family phage-related lysozyme (muramidase)